MASFERKELDFVTAEGMSERLGAGAIIRHGRLQEAEVRKMLFGLIEAIEKNPN